MFSKYNLSSMPVLEQGHFFTYHVRKYLFSIVLVHFKKMATEEDFDRWIEITKQCKYLPENELKVL